MHDEGAPPTFWLLVVLAAITLAMVFLASGCAHVDKRPPIVFAPTNPDLPAVVAPVTSAKGSSERAGASTQRAIAIANQLSAENQNNKELVERLKLELATTADALRLTGEQLDTAILQLSKLDKQILDMKEWGVAQQARATDAEGKIDDERARADREHKNGARAAKQRDLFVWVIAVLGTLAVLAAGKDIIASIARGTGAWAPLASIALFGFVTAASLGLFFALTQIALDLIV